MLLFSRKSTLFLATLILLLAAGLRLAQIGELPPGLHYDEAADTILAREIAEGRSAPLFVPAFTGKEVLFFYWAAGWMKLVGATPFAMRLAAAMMGVLTVAAAYRATREMFRLSSQPRPRSGETGVALLAAAFMATSFWHVLMSRLGFRSIAEPFVQALALAAVWRGLRLNRRGWLVAGGALVGLNLYTYLAARLFPIAVGLLFAYLVVADAGRRRERLIQFGLVALAAAIVFAPLGVYFLQNPDAFLTRITQVAPREGQGDALWATVARALGMFFVDGDPYVRFNLPGRPLFPFALGLLFVAGAVAAAIGVWRGRQRLRRAAYFFTLVSTLVMLLPTALAVNEITPSNLRAIGMMPAIFVLPALGTWMILKRMKDAIGRLKLRTTFILRPPALLLVAVLLIAGVGSLDTGPTYFADYARLPQLYYESDGDLVDIAKALNRDAPGAPIYIHALHYRHPTLAALAGDVPGVRSITGPDVLVFPTGPSLQVFAHLALGDRDWRARYLPPGARVDEVAGPDGQTSFELARVEAPPSIQPEVTIGANFANVVELLGYDLNSTPRSGETVDVTLFWRVRNLPDRGDYALFAELRDLGGYQFEWGRADSFDYPAEQWTPGELIVQRLRVPIAAGAPPGSYQLRVGWYSATADRRLPVAPGNGFSGTTAAVQPISIARALQPPAEDALGMGTRIDREAGAGLALLGASVQTAGVQPNAPLFFTLFWRVDRAPIRAPIEIRLRDAAAGRTVDLGSRDGADVFAALQPGDVVADRRGVRAPDAAEPGGYAIEVRAGQGEWIAFGAVRIEAAQRSFDAPPVEHPLQASFGDQIELLGYDLDRATLRPGESISLTLVWRALKTPEADFTVFTHLLDASGVQRGGKDNPPVYGTYNTSLWAAGEVVVDRYVIPLDAGAPPGDYALEIGLYRFDSGARLSVSVGGDALRLARLQVAP